MDPSILSNVLSLYLIHLNTKERIEMKGTHMVRDRVSNIIKVKFYEYVLYHHHQPFYSILLFVTYPRSNCRSYLDEIRRMYGLKPE